VKNSPFKQKNGARRFRGFSMLEMVAAAALVTGTMVPALSVIRDSMRHSRDLHRRSLLANYAVRILEDQAAYVAYGDGEDDSYTNWDDAIADSPNTGDFPAADSHGSIRYVVTCSDAPSDGGLVRQLMNIEATVFDDTNGNNTPDAEELQETYRTKVAKLNSYEHEEK